MKPDKFTVSELFDSKRRYVVPLFQRPYVWKRDDQWFPLWEDITDKAKELLDRESHDTQIGTHFLGAAVVVQIPTFGKQVPTYEIVDGQQRLSTLQILLIALRDFLNSINHRDYEADLRTLTTNGGATANELEIYKVWPTIADRSGFEAAYKATSPETLEAAGASGSLVEVYKFFYKVIDEYVQYGENDEEMDSPQFSYDSEMALTRIDALMEALRRHLEIVVIELESGDDPQIIFETLNARGVPLQPSDLIRNFVFLEASNAHEDVERLYREYWLRFDDEERGDAAFWKAIEQQGQISRARIDLFMFHYLTFKTGREIKMPRLFQEFQRFWSRKRIDSVSIEALLKDLQSYSEVYASLFNLSPDSRLGVFIYRLGLMDMTTLYPVLLLLYGYEYQIADGEREAMVIALESYLVRRLVCSLSTRGYNRVFLNVLRDLQNAETINSQALAEILLAFESNNNRWPNDDEFRQQWLQNPVYRRLAKRRVRLVFEAIDTYLETPKQEKLYIAESLSIEHIWPQNPSRKAWPKLDNPDVVNTIGNLTLLTDSLNSSVSNGPFRAKREAIAKQSKLRLNVFFQDMVNKTEWTVADIYQRAEDLFAHALNIWPRPSNPDGSPLSPGQKRAIDSLRAIAYQNGVGEAFDVLINAGVESGLYPAPSTQSVMFAPQNAKYRCLYTVWVTPRDRLCRVYVATKAFPEFFPRINIEQAEEFLGKTGWRKQDQQDARGFVGQLEALLDGA